MMDKQALLKRHRKRKRLALLPLLLCGALLAYWPGWQWLALFALLAFLAHEAWFSDHRFYAAKSDYVYRFPAETPCLEVLLKDGCLHLPPDTRLDDSATLLLQVPMKSRLIGWLFDPGLVAAGNRQDFERGAQGTRYVNLTGQATELLQGTLALACRFCRIAGPLRLYVLAHADYRQKRLLILAPHADDAELAAFGLYSSAKEVAIVTLTQGEIEAQAYRRFNLDKGQAAQLKGRLRTWDSLAVPLWGGVPQSRCLQLGYFCLQLPAMRQAPEQPFGSREGAGSDIRAARQYNPLPLPADGDGLPTWQNLLSDLSALLTHFRPEVVIAPHPQIDAHADHVATTAALREALPHSPWQPQCLLLYANHLHHNDLWPMGPAGGGVALPPQFRKDGLLRPYSHCLNAAQQLDKALALGMQHDLQGRLPFKKRLRRWVQHLLAARRWPDSGEDEFFRKAVRRHELFFVEDLLPPKTGS